MKKIKSWMIGIMFAAAVTVSAQTVVPSAFNYQGVLRAGDGTALAAGTLQVEFRLYTAATGGSAVWGRMYTVILDENGLFNVELCDDEGTLLSDSPGDSLLDVLAAAVGELFIGVTVYGDKEISPRQQLLSVPYALMAGDVHEARNNFTVQGELMVNDGAEVTGTVQANQMIIEEDDYQTTLTVNDNHSLTVSKGLHVGGNVAVEGKCLYLDNVTVQSDGSTIDVQGGLKAESLEVSGPADLAGGLSVAGETQVFGDLVPVTDSTYTAPSDGFLMIHYSGKETGNDNSHGIVTVTISGQTFDLETSRSYQEGRERSVFTWPMAKNDTFSYTIEHDIVIDNIWFRPLDRSAD